MKIENPIVLIVDDSENDALLMRTVFERSGLVPPLQFARDGVEAIDYLMGAGAFGDRLQFPLPTVMLLDLNMPRKNGFEVLAWLRQQPALKRLCVCVLSASNREEDVRRCYDLGANSFLVKPGNLDGLIQMARTLIAWLKLTHVAALTDTGRNNEVIAPSIFSTDVSGQQSVPATALRGQTLEDAPSPATLTGEALFLHNAQLDRRLEEKAQEVDVLRAEIEDFGRAVAHDLRTPLMAIGGYTDLLTERCSAQLDENGRNYLGKINASTDQLGRILVEIVAHAKEKSRAPFHHGEVVPAKLSA